MIILLFLTFGQVKVNARDGRDTKVRVCKVNLTTPKVVTSNPIRAGTSPQREGVGT